jgi:putative PIN family toxin of toxin-antitoxin system
MRVVLDANVLVSFLLSGGETISSIFNYWDEGAFALVVSEEIVAEVEEVVDRLVLRGRINPIFGEKLMRKIRKRARVIKVTSKVNLSKDKKDNRYLECAKDGKAEYLVTGNFHHLTPIKKYEFVKIITPHEFLQVLRKYDYKFKS